MDDLVFIDTNIFLDFYRVIGREGGITILNHLQGNQHRIITGNQVEMEYMKNRQKVILDANKQLFQGDKTRTQLPAILAQSKSAKAIYKRRKELEHHIEVLKKRAMLILRNPHKHDIVYQKAHNLFRSNSTYNLTRSKKERFSIRRLALKRFMLGYPPRKAGDVSIGDAINWEWMIKCVKDAGKGLVIVSRDSDYGEKISNDLVLNDWLVQEFKARVSRKRNITLTDRLTEGFKMAGIKVTRKEEKDENDFINKMSLFRQYKNIENLETISKDDYLLWHKIYMNLKGKEPNNMDDTQISNDPKVRLVTDRKEKNNV